MAPPTSPEQGEKLDVRRQARHFSKSLFAFRLAVGAFLLLSASYATLDWAAAVSRDKQPEFALQARSSDSLAQAQLASRMQLRPEKSDEPALARNIALAALRRDPTLSQAVRAIGFLDLQTGDIARAARAISFTHQMTRRDVATELWLIEYNVQLGNVPETLEHFDAAASTSIDIQRTLFPILASALRDARLIPPMAKMLERRPWWIMSLLRTAADGPVSTSAEANASHATNVLVLFERLARKGFVFQQETVDHLVKRLPPDQQRQLVRARSLPVA